MLVQDQKNAKIRYRYIFSVNEKKLEIKFLCGFLNGEVAAWSTHKLKMIFENIC